MTRERLQQIMATVETAPEVKVKRDRFGYKVDGVFYRRVTTMLGGYPKPWLGTWAAKEVAQFAYDHREAWLNLPETDAVKLLKGAPWSKRDDAADRGTAVHQAVEAVIRNTAIEGLKNEDELNCAIAVETFLKERASRILGVEITVFNRTIGYAGTLDLWDIDSAGTSWILDWKTSGDVYVDHAIQQAAYLNAEYAVVQSRQVGDKEEWIGKVIPWGLEVIERLGIVHVTPEGAVLHPIRQEVIQRLWTVFRAAAHMKAFQTDVDDFNKAPKLRVFENPVARPVSATG